MRKELDKLNNLRLSDIKAINKFVEMWEKSENNNLRYICISPAHLPETYLTKI